MKAALAAITMLACCEVLGARQERLPAFEVATVKPSAPESPTISIRRLPGGRLVTSNTPLPMLIQWAYQLDEGRYTLVTDSSGPKVRAVTMDGPADPNPFKMSDSGSLTGTRVTADMLATVLSSQLGRPVQNMTGFTGVFDFTLRWTPDTGAVPASSDDRPSLFTAIREQLGFRLVSRRTPTDVVVIDHVERTPAEN
jgi:hypothetical protein